MTSDRANRAPELISRGRVEALSDGVFAIVVTLLVLEITVPHVAAHDSTAELARAPWTLAPKFVSWVISVVTVCVIWLNHHRLFTMVGRIDHRFFWLNANLKDGNSLHRLRIVNGRAWCSRDPHSDRTGPSHLLRRAFEEACTCCTRSKRKPGRRRRLMSAWHASGIAAC
jgi:hypothetical protein